MVRITNSELAALIDDLRKQLSELTQRVAQLEVGPVAAPPPAAPLPEPARVAAPPPPPAVSEAPVISEPQVSEEELIAISAALAAYLGVRVHIRQIRLIGSRAWAQEGRVSIQASHRLHS
jgi:methylmalonyl-CoA carboxyltransferase 12S subunit